MEDRKSPSMKILGPLTTLIFAAVGFGLAYALRRENLFGSVSIAKGTFSLSLPSLGVAAAGALLAFLVAGLLYLVLPSLRRSTESVAHSAVSHLLQTEGWAGVVLGVLLTPVGEEILFRGGLQSSLGLVLTSVLFGFSHGGWRRETWSYAVATGLIGLILGEVYAITGSLTASSFTHVAYNLAVTVLLLNGWWPFRAESGVKAV